MRADRRRLLAGTALAALGASGLPGCASTAGIGAQDAAAPTVSSGAPAGSASGALPPAIPAALEEVPYVQTPDVIVDAMLDLAEVARGDTLIDLGSGDGRVVIRAATRFQVPGLGVEIDPRLVELSRDLARKAGVSALARFETQDLFETDLTRATVITLYLLPDVNLALRPRLLALAPGTRIVSHDWDMADWLPDRSVVLPAPGKPVGLRKESQMHRWTVPAVVEGIWLGRIEGDPATELEIRIVQQFQRIGLHWRSTSNAGRGRTVVASGDARMMGARARLKLESTDGAQAATLVAGNGRLEGTIQTPQGERRWRASRVR
ncbi:MAG TPA: methyltransferase domain-containing protein [Burkholderiaceae bacterium]|nr:methyltransferase domain-containing protein [Burkholderiaceae bacterium]